ncbi:uncharacterized protein LOC115887173 [Sitophilus oryzae]|uniref:Uncharacterized protein LOC115887173 n=1 Tax=Sitophilus oryzae TaxID=7048 RepID=A0A6J2YEM7_SITOR|nr:uncharacterized protein LOC115887173 [Sitophilus oryzae]
MEKIYLWLMFYWTFFSTKTVKSSAVVSPYYPLNGEDLIEGDIKEIEFWEKYYHRPKRSGDVSGSADIVNQFKSALVSGLKQKLGQLAQGSAGAVVGASAGFSKGSSSGHGEAKGPHTSYDHPHVTYEKPSFNLWDLKKSVLNTLLQAVKAIQGGVLAIKGQIIKGSGYVVSGGGKLLAAGGDKVTDIGKSIIQKAVLVPPKTHSSYHHSGIGTFWFFPNTTTLVLGELIFIPYFLQDPSSRSTKLWRPVSQSAIRTVSSANLMLLMTSPLTLIPQSVEKKASRKIASE